MKKTILNALSRVSVCAAAVAIFGSGGAQAQTFPIFANSGSTNGNFFSMPNGVEIGNEITVAPGSTLASFAFEYSASNALPANVGVDLRFYYNNVPYPTYPVINQPGTLFFDSGWFYNGVGNNIPSGVDIHGNFGYNITYTTSDFSSGALDGWSPSFTVPTDFTYTITWTNLTSLGEINMPLANDTPGITGGAYWINNAGTWEQETNTSPVNLLVDLESPVPEPTVFGLAAVGGALLLGASKLRRKR